MQVCHWWINEGGACDLEEMKRRHGVMKMGWGLDLETQSAEEVHCFKREREKTTFSNSNHIELPQETLIFSLLLCKLLNSFHFQSQIFAPVKITPFSAKLTIMIKHALFPFQCATSSNKASWKTKTNKKAAFIYLPLKSYIQYWIVRTALRKKMY